jgi:hypothetical protein
VALIFSCSYISCFSFLVALSFGGFGIESEAMPRTPEELKDFYRNMGTFSGKPMDEWYCDLVDFVSGKDGEAWRKAHYEECKIRKYPLL